MTLQDWLASATQVPVTVQLRLHGGSTTTAIVNLDSAGNYTLPNVVPGVYDLAFKASHWLQEVVSNVTVSADVSGINASLINGDANGDNVINYLDLAVLATTWQKATDLRADFNGDGIVDQLDLDILSKNWDLSGDP